MAVQQLGLNTLLEDYKFIIKKINMKKKVYISGKITGLVFEDALESFAKAEQQLIKEGFEVVNPMTLNHDHDKSWASYMREDVKAMLDCTHIYMLEGWHDSRGANIEYNLACELNIIYLC